MVPVELLGIYLHLARASQLRRRPFVRVRLLVLAAALACHLRLPRIAGYCRRQVLGENANHMLGKWPTVALALEDYDFQHLLKNLQQHYPPEKAERLLHGLGIDTVRERRAYFSDEEYAAALLGTSCAGLADEFGDLDDES